MSCPLPGVDTPIPDLCGSCRYRGLTITLNNETSTQDSLIKFFCKAIPELVFESDEKQAVEDIDITEPAGVILDVRTFITNCTEYEKVCRIIILAASYDVPTLTLTVTYQVIGLPANDTVEFWLNEQTTFYDSVAIVADGTYTQVSVLGAPLTNDTNYRVFVKLTTDGAKSQFLPIRVCESVVLLALLYDPYYTELTINYSQYDTDGASSLEIWQDGVLFDTITPVVNGENQTYIDTGGLTPGVHEFYLVDLTSGYQSNTLSITIPPLS